MKTYPIMLNVAGRRCVVVGAGPVGLRKAEALRRAGADVALIDPDPPPPPAREGIAPLRRRYDKDHLAGALLVLACTNDAALNARIAADARAAGALVNAADQPEDCDFFVPAVAGEGEVVLAVGTGGASPALAAALKDRLARRLPPRVGAFAGALRDARRHVRERVPDAGRRREILTRLAGRAGYKVFMEAGLEGLIELADEAGPAG